MSDSKIAPPKIQLPIKQTLGMIFPYIGKRIAEQIKSVWLIVLYLILFQTMILGIPIVDASVVSAGVILVVLGLTFFMEGLLLGLMPLGEIIGVKLPQKSKLPIILIFSFILGIGATFAEPAVGILKVAGSTVKAWEAPLLFILLNKYSNYLVYAVGVGVGIAVVFGMLRFLYSWSLKPFIYILVSILLVFSIWASIDSNMVFLTGLAWDCGGVTTGPVTVPLVLALGIGICRIVSKRGGSSGGGFGVVTLASAFPIITVLLLGVLFLSQVPKPMSELDFVSKQNRIQTEALFENAADMTAYVLKNASREGQLAYFDGNRDKMSEANTKISGLQVDSSISPIEITVRNLIASIQAIIPLSIFFLLVLWFILRERAPKMDELLLGISFAVIGMTIFSMGIEMGLSKLGGQVGDKLPAAFKSVELTDQRKIINNFDPTLVQTAVSENGTIEKFFYLKTENQYSNLSYDPASYDQKRKQYTYVPRKGPLFGATGSLIGIAVVLLFAFVMGYGATLAEPALNALGLTVEELTIGTFKKSLLMQAVAIGVGLGMLFGVAKIIWSIPLIWLLAPPYIVLLFITWASNEDFVNIGWDSAGVTTGPITVPLVLAMGLGIGGQVGVVEGFGILAMASVYPILTVLLVGLWVNRQQKSAVQETTTEA